MTSWYDEAAGRKKGDAKYARRRAKRLGECRVFRQ
jgi:hypothetical protein